MHPHESPLVMTVPLILLGAASVVGGLLLNNWISGWLDPAVGGEHAEATGLLHFSADRRRDAGRRRHPGWRSASGCFGPRRDIPRTQPASTSPFVLAGRNDVYGDAFNEAVFMRPGQRLTDGLVRLEDSGIDGTVNGTATAIGGLSGRLRRLQNGFVRSYALTMTAGAAVVGAVLVLGRLG